MGFSRLALTSRDGILPGDEQWAGHAHNFALIEAINRPLAKLPFERKLKTAIEEREGRPFFGAKWHKLD